MSASTFDPWAELARIEREMGIAAAAPPASPPPPISRISGISRAAPGKIENARAARRDGWLTDISRAVVSAVEDGAEREADPDGFLLLVRPDGARLVVTPGAVVALDAAGLLPPLPPALARSTHAATARPSCWSDPENPPTEGDRCACGTRRWWTYTPKPDGWCCVTCHPPPRLPPTVVRVLVT